MPRSVNRAKGSNPTVCFNQLFLFSFLSLNNFHGFLPWRRVTHIREGRRLRFFSTREMTLVLSSFIPLGWTRKSKWGKWQGLYCKSAHLLPRETERERESLSFAALFLLLPMEYKRQQAENVAFTPPPPRRPGQQDQAWAVAS